MNERSTGPRRGKTKIDKRARYTKHMHRSAIALIVLTKSWTYFVALVRRRGRHRLRDEAGQAASHRRARPWRRESNSARRERMASPRPVRTAPSLANPTIPKENDLGTTGRARKTTTRDPSVSAASKGSAKTYYVRELTLLCEMCLNQSSIVDHAKRLEYAPLNAPISRPSPN